jgi:hypothetical protein
VSSPQEKRIAEYLDLVVAGNESRDFVYQLAVWGLERIAPFLSIATPVVPIDVYAALFEQTDLRHHRELMDCKMFLDIIFDVQGLLNWIKKYESSERDRERLRQGLQLCLEYVLATVPMAERIIAWIEGETNAI